MRTSIISYNVNGIRSVLKKGFLKWLRVECPHILCMQEVRATERDVSQADLHAFEEMGYKAYWMPGERKGYGGVATFTTQPPKSVSYGCGMEKYDREGRVLCLDFGTFSLMNVYMPSGQSGEERLTFKHQWQEDFQRYVRDYLRTKPRLVVCGDYNVAHKDIDIHHPERHKRVSGFLPEERAWLSSFLAEGFVDSFRLFNESPYQYTWWNPKMRAKERNLGWRIDYHMVSEKLRARVRKSVHLPEINFSDHCPILLEISEGDDHKLPYE